MARFQDKDGVLDLFAPDMLLPADKALNSAGFPLIGSIRAVQGQGVQLVQLG